jgi:hypothetical protein
MPITQPRMITLINAARDYMQALQDAQKLLQEAKIANPDDEELRTLATLISESALLRHPIDSRLTIERETEHFRKSARYNAHQRDKQARRRRGKGLDERRERFLPIEPEYPTREIPIPRRSSAPLKAPGADIAPLFGSAIDEANAILANQQPITTRALPSQPPEMKPRKKLDPTMSAEPTDFGIDESTDEIDFHAVADEGQLDEDLKRAKELMEKRDRGEI